MERQAYAFVLGVIAILLIFGIVQPLFPFDIHHYSELGILGPDRTVSSFPTSAHVGQVISLYGFIGNHEGDVRYYDVVAKFGNKSTTVSNITSAKGPILLNYSVILGNNESFVFPMNITIPNAGENQRIIFELWNYNISQSEFDYTGLWNQVWINVSST